MRRFLLVETLGDEAHRHHRAEFFPFLLGLAREAGWAAEWWTICVPHEAMHVGRRFVVEPPEALRRLLCDELAVWAPDAVVFHDSPGPELRRAIAEAAPTARVDSLTHGFGHAVTVREAVDFLGGSVHPGPGGVRRGAPHAAGGVRGASPGELSAGGDVALADAVRPRYARRLLGDGDDRFRSQPLRIIASSTMACGYRRPVRANPFYRHLTAPVVVAHRGCAFCTINPDSSGDGPPFETPPVELAMRQIEAHQADTPPPEARFAYIFDDSRLSALLVPFLTEALRRPLAPSVFHALIRADTFLALRPKLERLLPALARVGHGVALLSMGAESFSREENDRFNKGLTIEQLWETFEALRDLERRFPETFSCPADGYFAAILFTPWTRLADLRANVDAARRLGSAWLRRAVGTRLQLRPGTAIVALAQADGLTTAAHGSGRDIEAVCLSGPAETELPWRFAEPATELVHSVVIRLRPLPEQSRMPPDDPLLMEIQQRQARLPTHLAEDYVALVAAIIDAVDALGADASPADLFRHVWAGSGLADEASGDAGGGPCWDAWWIDLATAEP